MSPAEITRASLFTLAQQILSTLVGLCALSLCARAVGPVGQGQLSLITAAAYLLVTIAGWGLPAGMVVQVGPEAISVGNGTRLAFYAGSLLGLLGAVLFAALALFVTSWPLSLLSPQMVLVGALWVPAILTQQLLLAVLQGRRRFFAYNLVCFISPFCWLLLTCVCVYGGFPLLAFATVTPLAHTAACLTALAILTSAVRKEAAAGKRFERQRMAPWLVRSLRLGGGAAIGNLLGYLNYRSELVILEKTWGAGPVGIYSTAASVAERLWVLGQAPSAILFAVVAAGGARDMTPRLIRVVTSLMLCLGAIMMVAAPSLVAALFGPDYELSSDCLRVLVPGVVSFNTVRLINFDLLGRGHMKLFAVMNGIALALALALDYALIPERAALGAALACALTDTAMLVQAVLVYQRVAKVSWRTLLVPTRDDLRVLLRFMRSPRPPAPPSSKPPGPSTRRIASHGEHGQVHGDHQAT